MRAILAPVIAALVLSGPATEAQTTVASRQVDVFGQKIHFLESGSGSPVILLHGLADDADIWAETIPALASKFRVFSLDQIGFGESDKPPIQYRVRTLVEFLDGFYKAAAIDRATLIGNSLGGWVAAAFAIAHPEKVDRLVLVDAAGLSTAWTLTRETLASLNISTMAGMRQALELILYDQSRITDAMVEQAWTAQLKKHDGYTVDRLIESFLRKEDFLDDGIGRVAAPTLVVWGREDRLTPLAGGEAFTREIRGARLRVIDRCGHEPQLECPEPLNAAVLDFLSRK